MGRQARALQAVGFMLKQGCPISEQLLLSLLDHQGLDLEGCRFVHCCMSISAPGSLCVSGPLIRSLANLQSLLDVNLLFCQVINPTVHTWQAIIYAHFVNGEGLRAIETYHKMVDDSQTQPNRFVFSCVLRACTTTAEYLHGMLVHEHIITCGLDDDVVLGSTLIDMYAKCGTMMSAKTVFDRLQKPNIVSWNALLSGYVRNQESHTALKLLQDMLVGVTIVPSKVTFLCAIKACGELEDVKQGRTVHQQAVNKGLDIDLNIGNTLIDMYAKCQCMAEALHLLCNIPVRDVVSWSAIIAGAVQCGNGVLFSQLYKQMVREGIVPDRVMLIGLLNACAHAKDAELGTQIHDEILERGFGGDLVVRGALIDMYAKCNKLDDARKVFDETPNRSLMLWGLMITGYAQRGEGGVALELYEKMKGSGVKPDKFLFSALLKVCGDVGALEQGKALHGQMGDYQVEPDIVIGTTLIGMYTKCGEFEKACKVFEGLPYRDDVSWCVGKQAIQCLRDLEQCRMQPIQPYDTGLLCTCQHDRIQSRLSAMTYSYPSDLIMCYYNMVVDILGHIGHLETARGILETMPVSPNAINWMSLLSRCTGHGNSELAQHCMIQIMQRQPSYEPVSQAHMGAAQMWSRAAVHKSTLFGTPSKMPQASCDSRIEYPPGSSICDELDSLLEDFSSGQAMVTRHDLGFKESCESNKQCTVFGSLHQKNRSSLYLLFNKLPTDLLTPKIGCRDQIKVACSSNAQILQKLGMALVSACEHYTTL